MVEFQGGPANGKAIMLRRAPYFLRVVTGPRGGKLDALDRWADEPANEELVYVYRRIGKATGMWVRPGGRFAMAKYEFFEPQPDASALRETNAWRAWAIEQHAADLANK